MKITLVIPSLQCGGAERVITHLANYWASKEHTVSLVTLEAPGAQPSYDLSPSVHLVQINQSGPSKSYLKRAYRILKRIFVLRKTLKNTEPDVIVSFLDIMNITTLIATRYLNTPTIVSERIDPHFHKISKIACWMRRLMYPYAKALVVQTKSAESYFSSGMRQRSWIIPNPVIPAEVKKSISPEVREIVSIGRLAKQKGFDVLIQAFGKLRERYPELCLTIYGEGPDRLQLEELVRRLGLESSVSMPGFVKDIAKIHKRADLFVSSSYYEGFPNVVCEALAAGLAVVVSDASGNVDVVRNRVDGLIFKKGSVDALVDAVSEMIEDYDLRKTLAHNAPDVVKRFSQEQVFGLWDALLEDTK